MCAAVDAVAAEAPSVDNVTTISFQARHLFTGEVRALAFPRGARVHAMPGLRESKKTRQDCDVVFKAAEGPEIWAHRFVLAATYPACEVLFTACAEAMPAEKMREQQEWIPPIRVIIADLSSDMLELLVGFAYYEPLHERVGFHNANQVLELAETLNIRTIRHHCVNMLARNLQPDSCIGTYHLAVSKGYGSLADEAFLYLVRNFDEVWRNSLQFQSLAPSEMRAILEDDRLNTPGEVEHTFRAILKWIAADVDERKKYLAQFLLLVRFVQCTVKDWEQVVTDPQIQADEDSLKILNVVHQTLSRHSMSEDECAGVDLSVKTWLTPRVPKSIVFLFGGGNWVGHNKMHTYNCRTGTWRLLGKQPTAPRSCHGVAVLNSCIYFVGGSNGMYQSLHTVACLDVSRNQWSKKANMFFARCNVCVAVLQGLIYAIGGHANYIDTDTVERYDPKSNTWCQVASMDGVRSCASSAVARGRIYVVGGSVSFRELDTVDCYDPSADAWTRVLRMISPRRRAQAVACGDLIYVLGGDKEFQWLTSMEQLDLRRSRATELASMSDYRSCFATVLLEGCIYAIGGGDERSSRTAVERYDIKSGQWHPAEDVPIDLYSCFGATACLVHDVDDTDLWL